MVLLPITAVKFYSQRPFCLVPTVLRGNAYLSASFPTEDRGNERIET